MEQITPKYKHDEHQPLYQEEQLLLLIKVNAAASRNTPRRLENNPSVAKEQLEDNSRLSACKNFREGEMVERSGGKK